MLKSGLNELKQIAKMRRIKGYKSMSKKRLLSSLNEPECIFIERCVNNFDHAKIKEIRKKFNKLKQKI